MKSFLANKVPVFLMVELALGLITSSGRSAEIPNKKKVEFLQKIKKQDGILQYFQRNPKDKIEVLSLVKPSPNPAGSSASQPSEEPFTFQRLVLTKRRGIKARVLSRNDAICYAWESAELCVKRKNGFWSRGGDITIFSPKSLEKSIEQLVLDLEPHLTKTAEYYAYGEHQLMPIPAEANIIKAAEFRLEEILGFTRTLFQALRYPKPGHYLPLIKMDAAIDLDKLISLTDMINFLGVRHPVEEGAAADVFQKVVNHLKEKIPDGFFDE